MLNKNNQTIRKNKPVIDIDRLTSEPSYRKLCMWYKANVTSGMFVILGAAPTAPKILIDSLKHYM